MALIKVNNRGQSSDFSTEIGATKNLIINGAMQVAQRGTSGTATGDGFYPSIDRFKWRSYGGAGRASFEQSTDTPNGDFRYSLKATVTTVNSGLDQYDNAIGQVIEGYNRLPLGWGTSSPSPCTISFWVKTSIAGIYSVSMRTGSGARSQVQETPSLTANTWTKVTLTFVGDTDGEWLTSNYTTNGSGIIVEFNVGRSNAKNTTTLGSWIGSNRVASDNQVRWIENNGATFYLCGVQVEKGSAATEFEHLSFSEELLLCQRYFISTNPNTLGDAAVNQSAYICGTGYNSRARFTYYYPTPMRTKPAGTLVDASGNGNVSFWNTTSRTDYSGSWTFENSLTCASYYTDTTPGTNVNGKALLMTMGDESNNTNHYLELTAEM